MTSATKSNVSTLSTRGRLSVKAKKLRHSLLRLLKDQGFTLGRHCELKIGGSSKRRLRAIHSHFRKDRLEEEKNFVHKWYPRVSRYFASGADIDPQRIDPYPVLVDESEEYAALFRIASLWWSIPVSRGYGRRFRILIFDKSNGKLFGLLALTDPVFNLKTRDAWVGWGVRTRENMLAHVMDACVLAPYLHTIAYWVRNLSASSLLVTSRDNSSSGDTERGNQSFARETSTDALLWLQPLVHWARLPS